LNGIDGERNQLLQEQSNFQQSLQFSSQELVFQTLKYQRQILKDL